MRWWLVVGLAACGRSGFEMSPGGDGASADTSGTVDDGNAGDGAITVPIDAAPGTLLPPPDGDTYIMGVDTTPNGPDIDLKCGRNSGNGSNMWTLLRFDLTAIAATSVSNATMRLYQYSSLGSGTMTVEVYRVTQQWDEPTADWSMASSTTSWPAGGAIASTIYTTTPVPIGTLGYYDWDVTTLVNEWLAGTNPNDGLQLQYQSQPATGTYVVFASRDHATSAWRPQLLLTP